MPSTQAWGYAQAGGLALHSSTFAKAFWLRLETVPLDTDEPQGISPASSMRLVLTPAGHVSIMASSTELSRLR